MPKLKDTAKKETTVSTNKPIGKSLSLEEFRDVVRDKIYSIYPSLNQYCISAKIDGYPASQIYGALTVKKNPSRKLLMKIAEDVGIVDFKEVKTIKYSYVRS